MPEASVDAVVTDPPYELGFMGKRWDASGIAFSVELWREVLRVLKPGGYLLAFSGTRTYHRMTCAIEDAGFEIRDCIGWHYGSGFPKSLDVSKAIDKAAGAEREVLGLGVQRAIGGKNGNSANHGNGGIQYGDVTITAPATDAAKAWAGWGTALKPAWEPVVVARKPLEGTVAANVLKYGTGAMNIDASRVPTSDNLNGGAYSGGVRPTSAMGLEGEAGGKSSMLESGGGRLNPEDFVQPAGRWPANVLLSHAPDCSDENCVEGCPCAAMDAQSGGDGASRFFNRLPIEADDLVPFLYTAKASRSEREAGCSELPEQVPPAVEAQGDFGKSGLNSPRAGAGRTATGVRNHHPTVKPISVMRHLVRLVTPPGGTVLDPFTGSGSTGCAAVLEGKAFIGCEMQPEYVEIARARIAHHGKQLQLG
jgi:site-specific DNA-methyltransferase (adenine-specific)